MILAWLQRGVDAHASTGMAVGGAVVRTVRLTNNEAGWWSVGVG